MIPQARTVQRTTREPLPCEDEPDWEIEDVYPDAAFDELDEDDYRVPQYRQLLRSSPMTDEERRLRREGQR